MTRGKQCPEWRLLREAIRKRVLLEFRYLAELLCLDVLTERNEVIEISVGLETHALLHGIPDKVTLEPDVSQDGEHREELKCARGRRTHFQVALAEGPPRSAFVLTQARRPSEGGQVKQPPARTAAVEVKQRELLTVDS